MTSTLWNTNLTVQSGIGIRYLKEAIDKYLDDYVDPAYIMNDIRNVFNARSETALDAVYKNQSTRALSIRRVICYQLLTDYDWNQFAHALLIKSKSL